MPYQNQIDYCETDRGGNLLIVSVNAANDETRGHRVQLSDRIAGYPDGYRG